MGGRDLPAALVAPDGRRYYTVQDTAALLGAPIPTVRRKFDLVLAKGRVEIPSARGRPIVHVVDADLVDERRRELLESLLVGNDGNDDVVLDELKQLRRRVRELESSFYELAERYEAMRRVADAQGEELKVLRPSNVDQIAAVESGGPL